MTRKDIANLYKRFFITFACLLPIFIVLGILLGDKIQSWILIVIYVTIGGGVLALEEFIHHKKYMERQAKKEQMEMKNGK